MDPHYITEKEILAKGIWIPSSNEIDIKSV